MESQSDLILRSNLFLQKARSGGLSESEIALYLFNLMHIFAQTPGDLHVASAQARAAGDQKLAEFLEEKIQEETGHENWPKADLNTFPKVTTQELELTDETRELTQYIHELAENAPLLYLVYQTFVELITVRGAPDFVTSLEEKCGHSRTRMTAIVNHQVSDTRHIEEDFEVLDKLLSPKNHSRNILETIERSAKLVNAVLASCAC